MFVVLEGIDGSGKGTQAAMLLQRLGKEGIASTKLAFPQYGRTPFAEAISEYLNGVYGGVNDVHPKLASLLFAGDRFASKDLIESALANHEVVVCDRYIASNLAHQSAKLPESERTAFIDWLSSIEYGAYGLPKADLTIHLDIPVRQARQLVEKKAPRDQHTLFAEEEQGAYTALVADIHEQDTDYLAACRKAYQHLVREQIGGTWKTIACTEGSQIRSADEIGEEIWQLVRRS